MSLWLLLALMTAAAMLALLWPLGRRLAPAGAGADVAVYRDQLAELDRDRVAGLIGIREAEAARTEIGRRLLSAADASEVERTSTPAGANRRRRAAALAALILLPAGAAVLYGTLGSPQLPGAPLAERVQALRESQPLLALVAQVEAHLAANPQDGRGWEVLAPVYLRLGRFEDAVTARRNALRLLGATAVREADLGEALVLAANGVVTEEARATFERALALDASEFKARYFIGLAAEQDGKPAQAASLWRALLADAPADAPWRELVQRSLARVDPSSAPAGPGEDEIAAAEKLSPQERAIMVRSMVERLAVRLAQDGNDSEGWLRLVRAYMVLGEPEKAKAAAADARRAASGDADKLRRLAELMKTLGLET